MTIGGMLTTPAFGSERYIKQPPVASSESADGATIDAETAIIVHHNASRLSQRSTRIIGQAHIGGIVGYSGADKDNSPYTGIIDLDKPTSFRADQLDRIPWTIRDSVRFGPWAGSPVSLSVSPPGFVLRKVRVAVKYDTTTLTATKHLFLQAAITSTPSPPRTLESVVASASTDITAATVATWTGTLTPLYPVRHTDEWISRPNANLEFLTRVSGLYVWVGWDSTDTVTGHAAISNVSAFEVWQ